MRQGRERRLNILERNAARQHKHTTRQHEGRTCVSLAAKAGIRLTPSHTPQVGQTAAPCQRAPGHVCTDAQQGKTDHARDQSRFDSKRRCPLSCATTKFGPSWADMQKDNAYGWPPHRVYPCLACNTPTREETLVFMVLCRLSIMCNLYPPTTWSLAGANRRITYATAGTS